MWPFIFCSSWRTLLLMLCCSTLLLPQPVYAAPPAPYLAADLNTTTPLGSNPEGITVIGSTIYLAADDGADRELWKYANGVATKIDINPQGSSDPKLGVNVDGILYFVADDGSGRAGIRRVDR